MKRIGLNIFALLAVATAVPVVWVATLSTAKVTIHAIGPTGKVVNGNDFGGKVASGPEWLFGITNIGRAPADWYAAVSQRSVAQGVFTSAKSDFAVGNKLKPGEGLVTIMTAPTGDKTEWCGWVRYTTRATRSQGRLLEGFRTLGIARFLPLNGGGTFYESSWHTATNAPTASPTVTNTP